MLPALGPFEIAAVTNGRQHPVAFGLRPDIEHRHAGNFIGSVTVEFICSVIHDDETQRLGIINPHWRGMRRKQDTEVLFGRARHRAFRRSALPLPHCKPLIQLILQDNTDPSHEADHLVQ